MSGAFDPSAFVRQQLADVQRAEGGAVSEDMPYTIERAGRKGRIRLGPEARHWAREWGLSDREMAAYLLARDEQGPELSTSESSEDFLSDVMPQLP